MRYCCGSSNLLSGQPSSQRSLKVRKKVPFAFWCVKLETFTESKSGQTCIVIRSTIRRKLRSIALVDLAGLSMDSPEQATVLKKSRWDETTREMEAGQKERRGLNRSNSITVTRYISSRRICNREALLLVYPSRRHHGDCLVLSFLALCSLPSPPYCGLASVRHPYAAVKLQCCVGTQ